MSAVDVLRAAHAAGVRLRSDGHRLMLRAAAPPPAAILERLAGEKPAILALLRQVVDGRSVEMWHAVFERWYHRAAAAGGLDGTTAKARAIAACIADWLDRSRAISPPGRCLACGGGDQPLDRVLPYGTTAAGHAWLHRHCWPGWYASRKAEAGAALAAIGIAIPESAKDFGIIRG